MNDAPTAITEQSVISPNGVSLNGISPNVISPNGISPNVISPNGVAFNGVRASGVRADGSPVDIADAGPPLAGAELVGSTWTAELSTGATVPVRIDAAAQGSGANADVWSYRLSASIQGAWYPLCVDAAGEPGFADTVHGTWNLAEGVPGGGAYDAGAADFTVACRGSAIAKCLELGYKTWTGRERELASCVRALRSDFCGDGRAYTVDGTLVNIYDRDGIQTDGAAWEPEAEWTPDGASCVSKKKETRFSQTVDVKPACFPRTLKPQNSCGSGFSGGATIITELPAL